jgi:hypothetical protein
MAKTKKKSFPPRRSLSLMQELHAQFEARLIANQGQVFPLSQSVPPTPALIERVRQCFLQQQRDEEEAS